MRTTKKITKSIKTSYNYKKYGGNNRSYVPVANTINDMRCSISTIINRDLKAVCPNGYKICATIDDKNKTLIKMKCSCGITFEKEYSGIFNHFDAITDFCDNHREVA
jgi:hypothetical protein